MVTKSLPDIEDRLNNLFKKAPSLPHEIKNLMVQYGPYLILLGGVLGILASGWLNFFIIGFTPKLLEVSLINYYLQIILNIIASVILLFAFKPLLEKKQQGWRMLFYLNLLEVVILIFTVNLSGLLISLLGFYLLFQVREKYY
jgi:hypothetical protein